MIISLRLKPYYGRGRVHFKPTSGCWDIRYDDCGILFGPSLMNQHFQTFELLTGRTPFDSKGSMSDRIAEMRTVLQDEVPEPWLNDSEKKEYNDTTSGLVASIEKSLSESLHKNEAVAAASFIKNCLRLDPEKRLTAAECSAHAWLAEANACSCRFC